MKQEYDFSSGKRGAPVGTSRGKDPDHFTNDSEYTRDLIRRDRERSTAFEALQAAVQEGLDSGPSDKTVPSIMKEVEARLRSDGRL
ncbi:MAG: hypothetical protein J4G16_01500 [Acidobacteria bacterium]|nr:hypothetical protein [Acidobacteriota bacterium]